MERLTQITVLEKEPNQWGDLQPGQMCRVEGAGSPNVWMVCCPLCSNLGELRTHRVITHDDGTITVSPVLCRIIIRLRQITFRCSRMLNRQNRHALPHIFSLQHPATFSERLALANGHFRQTHERLCGRNNAASEAHSAHRAKRIVSETRAFAFARQASGRDRTAICRLEKLCGRSHQPLYNADPLCRLIDSKPAKSYSAGKRSLLSQRTSPSLVCNGSRYIAPKRYEPCTAHYFIEHNKIRWC